MSKTAPADLSELVFRLCATVAPVPGHATLLDALGREGGPEFIPRVSRGGWFRPGRIVDGGGDTIADDAVTWLEAAWAEADGDGEHFAERHAAAGCFVTHQRGVTHYLVLPQGTAPQAYLQLEIEELQEVVSHPLITAGDPAESAEALLEPRPGSAPPRPLGLPRYSFRRLTDIAGFVHRITEQAGKPAPVLRFFDEWAASSAGQHSRFCDHWVLALSEHLDRYRQTRYGAMPVAAHAPEWRGQLDPCTRGIALAQRLHDFDRAAGYGFAWYFHMVSGRRVPRFLPPGVFADLEDGMAYLPERDAALVRVWVEAPYSL